MTYPVSNNPILDEDQVVLLVSTAGPEGPAFYRECVALFQQEMEARIPLLDEALAQDNRTELQSLLHFLAGSGANLGFSLFTRLCRHSEEQLIKPEATPPAHLSAMIKEASETCIGASEAFINRAGKIGL